MKKIYIVLLCLLVTSCARGIIPIPEKLLPERYTGLVSPNEYGEYPENYQKILKDYLVNNLLNHSDAKVDFVNQPSKLSIKQLGTVYSGYRMCLSINSRNSKNIYTGYKTHLFVIKNDNVVMHLYDSGLLKIPFELCVERDESRSIYLEDIPDTNKEITIDQMDQIEITPNKEPKDISKSNTYILCEFDDYSRTFVFNENLREFSESIGIDEIKLVNVEYSSTHIFGLLDDEEILINRVSGEISSVVNDESPKLGNCQLLDSRKF